MVMGGELCFEGCGFKSQHHRLNWHFSLIFVVKIVTFGGKVEIKWKRFRGWPILYKEKELPTTYQCFKYERLQFLVWPCLWTHSISLQKSTKFWMLFWRREKRLLMIARSKNSQSYREIFSINLSYVCLFKAFRLLVRYTFWNNKAT